MYVCLCRRVTEAYLRAAIAAGARDLETVRRRCGASAGCGGCRPVVEAILAAATVVVAGGRSPEAPAPHSEGSGRTGRAPAGDQG